MKKDQQLSKIRVFFHAVFDFFVGVALGVILWVFGFVLLLKISDWLNGSTSVSFFF